MAKGRKTGGRQPGSRNKATLGIREIARGFIDDPVYRAALKARLEAGTAGAMEVTLWAYGYGKPTEPRDGSSLPARILIEF